MGNWTEPLEKISRKCVLDDSTDISISEGCRGFPASRSMWRAYAPHHVLDRGRKEEFVRLTFGGLCELWYTVGLLRSNATRLCHQWEGEWDMSSEGKEKWWFPLFRGLIHWLPELELLSPRICITCDSEFARMINPQLYEVDVGNLQWVGTFSSLSIRLGAPLTGPPHLNWLKFV